MNERDRDEPPRTIDLVSINYIDDLKLNLPAFQTV